MTITKRFWNLFRLKVSKTSSTCLELYSQCQLVGSFLFHLLEGQESRMIHQNVGKIIDLIVECI